LVLFFGHIGTAADYSQKRYNTVSCAGVDITLAENKKVAKGAIEPGNIDISEPATDGPLS